MPGWWSSNKLAKSTQTSQIVFRKKRPPATVEWFFRWECDRRISQWCITRSSSKTTWRIDHCRTARRKAVAFALAARALQVRSGTPAARGGTPPSAILTSQTEQCQIARPATSREHTTFEHRLADLNGARPSIASETSEQHSTRVCDVHMWYRAHTELARTFGSTGACLDIKALR
jgi:hypothetical protein